MFLRPQIPGKVPQSLGDRQRVRVVLPRQLHPRGASLAPLQLHGDLFRCETVVRVLSARRAAVLRRVEAMLFAQPRCSSLGADHLGQSVLLLPHLSQPQLSAAVASEHRARGEYRRQVCPGLRRALLILAT